MITEFELLKCDIRSDKPAPDRTTFFFDYESILVISGIRYRRALTIEIPIARKFTCDFVFSDSSVVRAGHISTLLCWQGNARRLVESVPTQEAWGYHIVTLSNTAAIENHGDTWTHDRQQKWQYLGAHLRLQIAGLEWMETVRGISEGRIYGERQKYVFSDYQTPAPIDEPFE